MNNLQNLLKDSKMSLKEISEETGIGYSTISNYFQGTRIPNTESTAILSQFFKVSPAYILGIDDEPNRDRRTMSPKMLYLSISGKEARKIDNFTPFEKHVGIIQATIENDQMDERIKLLFDEEIEEVILRAFLQTLRENVGEFIKNVNYSSKKSLGYGYVWDAWEQSDEYQKRQEAKKRKE